MRLIYKGGDMYYPLNYRGITSSCKNVTCNIYSTVLKNRLLAEESNVLNDEQNGFMKLRSCIDHNMYVLYTTVKNRLLHNKKTFACFIDAKTFDKVDRDCMWYKLHVIGMKGKMFIAIKSLYTGVT